MPTPDQKELRPRSTGTNDEAGTPKKVQETFNRLAPPGTTNPDILREAMKLAARTQDKTPAD